MPDGANQMWGIERFNVTEGMWDEKAALPTENEPAPTKAQTLPEMIKASIAAVDMDLRAHLLQNIIVTGGSTLLNGFTDRLNSELSLLYPGARIKLQLRALHKREDLVHGLEEVSWEVWERSIKCGFQRRNTRNLVQALWRRDANKEARNFNEYLRKIKVML
ncbi:hypothetical protein DID88_008829 [Monilinia fructigena]|uniref:Uncharacterized protein n=1 Tax=Monilinia fructigena TaxID=38457 RepID=A0A395J6K1_9HELO|nr:hypothetical protein DID88_008829 [Monilinia fructigena]